MPSEPRIRYADELSRATIPHVTQSKQTITPPSVSHPENMATEPQLDSPVQRTSAVRSLVRKNRENIRLWTSWRVDNFSMQSITGRARSAKSINSPAEKDVSKPSTHTGSSSGSPHFFPDMVPNLLRSITIAVAPQGTQSLFDIVSWAIIARRLDLNMHPSCTSLLR